MIFDYARNNFHEIFIGVEDFFLKRTGGRVIKTLYTKVNSDDCTTFM